MEKQNMTKNGAVNRKSIEEGVDSKWYHHHHHHHRSRRRPTSKFKRFIKKNRSLLINLLVILLAIAVIVVISSIKVPQINIDAPTDTNRNPEGTGVHITTSSIQIEAPVYPEDIPLVGGAVTAFLNRDLSIPLEDVIHQYKDGEKRLDIGLSATIPFEVLGLPEGVSVSSLVVEVSDNKEFIDPRVFVLKNDERSVKVPHLKTGTQYYYRINITLSNRSSTSVQGSFVTADTPRILSIEGAVNVRDMGGWKTADGKRVKQGLLYRGSELDGAVEKSYTLTSKGLNDMLTVLGIRTDMDLRSSADNAYGTHALGLNVQHMYYDSPMYGEAFAENGKETVRKIFSDLADQSNYPVYLHCTYGLDRTGTVCYLLEALLGVSEEDLMREYELSALYYGNVSSDAMTNFVNDLKKFDGETMQEKAQNYLLSIGVTPEEIHGIKQIFLEG